MHNLQIEFHVVVFLTVLACPFDYKEKKKVYNLRLIRVLSSKMWIRWRLGQCLCLYPHVSQHSMQLKGDGHSMISHLKLYRVLRRFYTVTLHFQAVIALKIQVTNVADGNGIEFVE